MLRKVSGQIRECLDLAAEARSRAEEAMDPAQKAEYLRSELIWIRMARYFEFAESLERFVSSLESLPRSPRSTIALVWDQRIIEAYNSLIVGNAHEELGGRRTASLVRHGPYEVRLVELARNLSAEGVEHFWLELFDHDQQRTIESYAGRTLVDFKAVESLCSKAKRLSLEFTTRLPVIAVID